MPSTMKIASTANCAIRNGGSDYVGASDDNAEKDGRSGKDSDQTQDDVNQGKRGYRHS
jgi:hypothetical protein